MPQTEMTSPLPASTMEAEEECGICYQDYGPDRKPHPLSTCRHVLCACCLEHLAAKDGAVTCPFCRAPSPLPSDDEARPADVTGKVKGLRRWLKRFSRTSRAGSRRQGSFVKDDIRDLALMSSFLV
ncbi:RING finger protein 227 [Pelodytes ibericus]